jgi:hypothetical protein
MRSPEALVRDLMWEFAARTGLVGGAPPRRYLWTDAFAVCNFLGLHRRRGEGRDLDSALRLVGQVHRVLGRHRPDDTRSGWISGLAQDQGERHPTRGGLRIGKPLPERPPGEPFDPDLEWERDGQYFHYLTQWMHALGRVAAETGQEIFHQWAVALALSAHAAFTHRPEEGGPPRMAWKMSVDLRRPLVPSMGHHDPLDALVSYRTLRPGACGDEAVALDAAIADAEAMCSAAGWATEDPLGTGGLLLAGCRLLPLLGAGSDDRSALVHRILADAAAGLDAFAQSLTLDRPAAHRLAFRELGLALGLRAVERSGPAGRPDLDRQLAGLSRQRALAARVEAFWVEPAHQRAPPWTDHLDINSVMLAASLLPEGYLGI